ncbi:hypothetical protein M434DRAFT_377316 [Hypoxylon sp. CO27-5]|nr:hypothetical protein M434DRAFT_377316 [Hypoxylon sp. CO27-5]
MSETNERAPLLPRPVQASGHSHQFAQSDSHVDLTPSRVLILYEREWSDLQQPIYLRVCHSSHRIINQKVLLFLRFIFASYLSAVFGVSLKYKLENDDEHTRWRIPFQFSTVAFCIQWAYHLLSTIWTALHLISPKAIEVNLAECHGHKFRAYTLRFFSPPNTAICGIRRFLFSLFYTIAHVFPFMNTVLYWALLVPSGHGVIDKGLFEEHPIKAFSIINVWSITSIIGVIEIFFLNSIRRQTSITGHIAAVMLCSGAYLLWAALGKLITGHSGLFFLDPDLMGETPVPIITGSILFIALSPGFFTYMYGLVAMRETVTAVHHDSSY